MGKWDKEWERENGSGRAGEKEGEGEPACGMI